MPTCCRASSVSCDDELVDAVDERVRQPLLRPAASRQAQVLRRRPSASPLTVSAMLEQPLGGVRRGG